MLTDAKDRSVLESALINPHIEQNWENALEAWESASPLQRSAVRGFAESMRAFILNLARDVSSNPGELDRVLATVYIHLKSQWILFNTQIGYRIAEDDERGGEEATCRAALVYTIIEALEGLINAGEAERLSLLLEDPEAATGTIFPANRTGGGNGSGGVSGGVDVVAKMQELEQRLHLFDAERMMLEREVGAGDAEDIVRRFRRLLNQITDLENEQKELQEETARLRQQFNDLDPTEAPRQLLTLSMEMAQARAQINSFFHDREVLERIIGTYKVEEIGALWHDVHMQLTECEQRIVHYEAQRAQLEREAGTAVTAEITSRLRTQNDQITALEGQIGPLIVNIQALERELGHSEAEQISAMIMELRQSLYRAETDMSELRAFRDVLSRELGTEDAHEIVSRFQQMNKTMRSFNVLANIVASLENDIAAPPL